MTLRWCKDQCPSYQASSSEQWLQPLTLWVIPALTLLILCSVGDNGEPKSKKVPLYALWQQIKGYFALLGDPASALYGAFAELWMNASMARRFTTNDETINGVLVVSMLASQSEFYNQKSAHMFMLKSNDEKQELVEDCRPLLSKGWTVSLDAVLQSEAQASNTRDTHAAFTDLIFT